MAGAGHGVKTWVTTVACDLGIPERQGAVEGRSAGDATVVTVAT
jgi:hypothetical protein